MSYSETERQDAARVDEAVQAMMGGELSRAEALLKDIARHTPEPYVYEFEEDGKLCIKFWDEDEFMHYVTWHRERGTDRSLTWYGSAYPRAWYYLGFLSVKLGKFSQAIELLDRGRALEPGNPRFVLETAHALSRLGQLTQALELYDSITGIGPHLSAMQFAAARRGRGFILIDLYRLDEAEAAFLESLQYDPSSGLARSELEIIDQMRQGAPLGGGDAVVTGLQTPKCVICGKDANTGFVANLQGRMIRFCESCGDMLQKEQRQQSDG